MALLKEDGSLNVDWVRNLSLEEKIQILPKLTQEQKNEYWSKLPINEGHMHTQSVIVNYTLEDELNNGAVIATDFLNKMREKYSIK